MPVRATIDQTLAHRQPNIIATDGYLNDPITFQTDVRFDLFSALQEASDLNVVDRDQGDFAVIDLGAVDEQNYIVEMITPTYSRANFIRVIK